MTNINEIRGDVLARMDRAQRNFKLAFFGAVALEAIFLIAFLFLADFKNRTHVLILMGTVMTYSILALGLVALGAHVNRAVLRVLHAIDAKAL
ncbi:MAG TPA: hypothetical protein VGQ65_13270 [Thermoanaerobaculia bacterium]|jgi:hypothetical protein|nr:hypothetical protein [Thermoanaerobaculia bacterium]